MIGSGDIYVRLHRANSALDERVTQVSLGAFKYPNDSRIFLQRGLERLALRHPWNSSITKEFDMRDKCRDAVWEAADGLPKSLNRLGYDIAVRGRGRSGVTANDVLECTQRMIEEHWVQYSQEFPDVLDLLETEPAAADLMKCMYEDGITRIHRVSRLFSRVCGGNQDCPSATPVAFEKAIAMLVETGFIVQTGKSAELLFVKHPAAAHTLGVVMRDPSKVKHIPVPRHQKSSQSQLGYVFPMPIDFDLPHDDTPSDDA